jgi:RNA polymerase sigma factor (sigma-70 family)
MYFTLIYSVIYGKMRNTHAAEDITQEVFVRFYEKYETIENHRVWLYGAMKNVIMEYARKHREIDIDIETLFADISMSYVNGFRDTRFMIEEALNNKDNFGDEKGRLIFDLIALNNYSYREAGDAVALSERQTRYRYNQITNRLMEHFRRRGVKGLEELL